VLFLFSKKNNTDIPQKIIEHSKCGAARRRSTFFLQRRFFASFDCSIFAASLFSKKEKPNPKQRAFFYLKN
jgi:hypothetical protein